MAPLWTSTDAIAATGGTCAAGWQAHGVSIDTRTLQAGDLFVALKAARDGHDFVAQALEKGAAAALVSYIPDGVAADAPLLRVDDVEQGLESLAIAAPRPRRECADCCGDGIGGQDLDQGNATDGFGGARAHPCLSRQL